MKILAVHPGGLFYTNLFQCLEPLGLELVAQVARQAGHHVKLIDLQVEPQKDYFKLLDTWQPDVVAISGNYLANFPEIIDMAKVTKKIVPGCYIVVGGHSASFIPEELLIHAKGAIDCVLKGEGEGAMPELLEAIKGDRKSVHQIPGAVTPDGSGPAPIHLESLDDVFPARDLLRKRRKYFIAMLDPCGSVEFSRGCPWDCAFCSAWTFYGRKYRLVSPEKAVEDLERIQEEGIFIVDDVAFTNAEHGMAIGEEILRKGLRKQFYVETRADVLIQNKEVFKFWAKVGLVYIFIGLEAIDEADLIRFRKRMTINKNFEALEVAHSIGIEAAINLIVDQDWVRERFESTRRWALEIPEFVNLSVFTPYPGTEAWLTERRPLISRDYRLFDMQHSVIETHLPLEQFYEELVKTQRFVNKKNLGLKDIKPISSIVLKNMAHGQVNFLKMLVRFNSVYNPKYQLADHQKETKYKLTPPPEPVLDLDLRDLYVLGGK